ncbi:hypothetical protein NY78_3700 [Desulfovibrio sp. TomC]|nr:hypothetical protein NY78_3700 [Desulfovibrio sp. TomC]
MKQTTIPDKRFWDTPQDYPGFAFYTRILRPLQWFGLLEQRNVAGDDKIYGKFEFKKSEGFDSIFSFRL